MDDKIRPYQSVDQVTIKTQIRHTIEKQGHHLCVAQGPIDALTVTQYFVQSLSGHHKKSYNVYEKFLKNITKPNLITLCESLWCSLRAVFC